MLCCSPEDVAFFSREEILYFVLLPGGAPTRVTLWSYKYTCFFILCEGKACLLVQLHVVKFGKEEGKKGSFFLEESKIEDLTSLNQQTSCEKASECHEARAAARIKMCRVEID